MISRLSVTGLLGVLVGCIVLTGCTASDGGKAAQKTPTATPMNSGGAMIQVPVEMKLVGIDRGKPPMAYLQFDVTMRNDDAEPRWFLFPARLSSDHKWGKGGVDSVEVSELDDKGRVIVGSFLGNDSFHAFLLPANAEVKVRRFVIRFWDEDEPEGPIPLEVITAGKLKVGDEDAEAWFGVDPTSDVAADVNNDQKLTLSTKSSPDGKEVPVLFVDDQHFNIEVDTSQKK